MNTLWDFSLQVTLLVKAYLTFSGTSGKKHEVQKRVLEMNSKALCVPFGSRWCCNVFCNIPKLLWLIAKAIHPVQWLCSPLVYSPAAYERVRYKALSTTWWECCVEAVKAMWYQLLDIVNALNALNQYAKEKKDAECTSSAESICKAVTSVLHGEYMCCIT